MIKTRPILFYFGHPSQYLFFRPVIRNLRNQNVNIILSAKKKDILTWLLDDDHEEYYNLLPEGRSDSRQSILFGLLQREIRLFRIISQNKPCLLVGTDPSLAHLGFLFRIPVITTLEDDYSVIKKLAFLTFPFTNCILTPDVCRVGIWKYKKVGYKGYMKLSYLHPEVFIPDYSKIKIYKRYVIFRLASLTAHHDFGIKGLNEDLIEKLITIIEKTGRGVIISSEYPVKETFQKYLFSINVSDMHHYLAGTDLLISDSQSMSVEAAILGIPSIRFSDFAGRISVLEELEHKYHLTYGITTSEPEKLLTLTEQLLNSPGLRGKMESNRQMMLDEKIRVGRFVSWFIFHYPYSFKYCRHHDLKGSPEFMKPPVTVGKKSLTILRTDFNMKIYQDLIQAMLDSNYELIPFADYFQKSFQKFIIVRQDVDDHKENSLSFARLQHALGIRSTFYFRMVPQSYDPAVVDAMVAMGHEIGYHYEDLDFARQAAKRQSNKRINEESLYGTAIDLFSKNLAVLRKHYPVTTICMHGSPLSPIDNKAIWKKYRYQDFGIIGEPYFDIDFNKIYYLTDTGRRWNAFRVSVRDKVVISNQFSEYRYKGTTDIIKALQDNSLPEKIHMTFHPQRWSDNQVDWIRELIMQNLKNLIKSGFYVTRLPEEV